MDKNSDWVNFKIELRERLRLFALDIIRLVQGLQNNPESWVLGKQVLKSGSSSYANYRAALRGRSKAEFFAKLCIVVEETDETEMWLELMIASDFPNQKNIQKLHKECLSLLKIVSHLRKTLSK